MWAFPVEVPLNAVIFLKFDFLASMAEYSCSISKFTHPLVVESHILPAKPSRSGLRHLSPVYSSAGQAPEDAKSPATPEMALKLYGRRI